MASFFDLASNSKEGALEAELQKVTLEKERFQRQAAVALEQSNLAEQRRLENESLGARVAALNTEVASLQSRLADMDLQLGEMINLRQEISGLKSSLQKTKDQSSLLKGQLDSVSLEHEGCAPTKRALEEEVHLLRQQKEEVDAALLKAEEDHHSELKALQEAHLREKEALQEELRVLKEKPQEDEMKAAINEVRIFESAKLCFRRIMWSLDPEFDWEKVKEKYAENVHLKPPTSKHLQELEELFKLEDTRLFYQRVKEIRGEASGSGPHQEGLPLHRDSGGCLLHLLSLAGVLLTLVEEQPDYARRCGAE